MAVYEGEKELPFLWVQGTHDITLQLVSETYLSILFYFYRSKRVWWFHATYSTMCLLPTSLFLR
jgi:hypothetical protein